MKIDVPLSSAFKLINVGQTVLVTCRHANRDNVFTVSWMTPVSIMPPIVAISCVKSNLSHEMIHASREFTINIPESSLLDPLHGCGKLTGRDTDKFTRFQLTREPGKLVGAPAIEECVGHLECRVTAEPVYGDFTLFIAEVVAAYADELRFTTRWHMEQTTFVCNVGDDYYTFSGEPVQSKLVFPPRP